MRVCFVDCLLFLHLVIPASALYLLSCGAPPQSSESTSDVRQVQCFDKERVTSKQMSCGYHLCTLPALFPFRPLERGQQCRPPTGGEGRKCSGETCISFTCNDIASGERQDIPLRESNFITQKCILDDHSAVSSLLYGAIDTCQLIKQETGELYRRFKHRLEKGAYRNILEKRSILDEIKCTKM